MLVCVLSVSADEKPPEPFVAWLADGKKVSSATLPAWPLPGNDFKVGGVNPLDPQNPVRLLRDRRVDPAPVPPLVFLANGDRVTALPGELLPISPTEPVPRVQLQLQAPLQPVKGTGVSVRTDQVLRILGPAGRLHHPPPPGVVLLADGSQLAVRSLRWRQDGLALLTAEGVREVSFGELGDVVFPGVELAPAVVADSLTAGSNPSARILRFAAAGGSLLTAAQVSRNVERVRSRREGSVLEVVYYIQPAWSSHPLAILEHEIAWVGYRSAREAPLSLLPAETLAQRGLLAPPAPWLRNHSPEQPLILTGTGESDLGIAIRAHGELAFTLPVGAETLRTQVGLDRSAGAGGCVQCRIVAEEPGGKLLWKSGFLTGADSPQDTGPLPVAGVKRVLLIVDCAHEGRPAGADPLDIRDEVCFVRPLVTLSAESLGGVAALASALPGLDGWRIDRAPPGLEISSQWNEADDRWNARLSLSREGPLRLVRKVKVDPTCDVVELRAACPLAESEHQFTLRVNGTAVDWSTNENRSKIIEIRERYYLPKLMRGESFRDENDSRLQDTLAYWWDLQAYRGQEVELELTLGGDLPENRLAWRGLALRGAIANLPAGGRLPPLAKSLTEVEPESHSTARTLAAEPQIDRIPHGRGEPIRLLGQRMAGGYGLRRNSFVSFPLRPEWGTFVAVVGCCEGSSGPLRVVIDERVAWEKLECSALEAAELIEIPIPAGAKSLRLEAGPNGTYSSTAAWVRAGFQPR